MGILPRSAIRFIRKCVEKWEKSDTKDLVKLLLASHEEMRWELNMYREAAQERNERRSRK